MTNEHKRKISAGNKGKHSKPHSEEWRRKISESMKGHKVSDETKSRISEGLKKYHREKEETNK